MRTDSFQSLSRTLLLVAIVVHGAACEKKAAPRESGSPQSETGTTLSQPARQTLSQVLASYEQLRADLARDETAATTGSAQAVVRAAKDAHSSAPEKLRPQLQKLAEVAQRLSQLPKQDASEVRRSFGQVSEAVVALLVAEPSLRAGRYLFECPMAQGYKKWVQSNAQISNPYMGTKMLECGTPSKWDEG